MSAAKANKERYKNSLPVYLDGGPSSYASKKNDRAAKSTAKAVKSKEPKQKGEKKRKNKGKGAGYEYPSTLNTGSGPSVKKRHIGLKIIAFIIIVLALALGVDALISNGKIHSGVYVGTVDVSSMTVDEAKKAIEDEYDPIVDGGDITMFASEEAESNYKSSSKDSSEDSNETDSNDTNSNDGDANNSGTNSTDNSQGSEDSEEGSSEAVSLAFDYETLEALKEEPLSGEVFTVTSSALGAEIASTALANEAFDVGRGWDVLWGRIKSYAFKTNIEPQIEISDSTLTALSEILTDGLGNEMVDPNIKYSEGKFITTEGTDGYMVVDDELDNMLYSALLSKDNRSFVIPMQEVKMEVTEESATKAADKAQKAIEESVTLEYDEKTWTLDSKILASMISTYINEGIFFNKLKPYASVEKVQTAIEALDGIGEIGTAAQNVNFSYDGKKLTYKEASTGIGPDYFEIAARLNSILFDNEELASDAGEIDENAANKSKKIQKEADSEDDTSGDESADKSSDNSQESSKEDSNENSDEGADENSDENTDDSSTDESSESGDEGSENSDENSDNSENSDSSENSEGQDESSKDSSESSDSQANSDVDNSTATNDANRVVVMHLNTSYPSVTYQDALDLDLTENMITSFTTSYEGATDAKKTNIHLISDMLTNSIISPGEVWSINDITGDCDESKGFVEGGSIIGGKIESEVGGGICQAATTIYDAVFYGGFEIVERHNHSTYISTYEDGMDAALSYPYYDFKFKNNTNNYIMLLVDYDDESVTCSIWGIGSGITVESEQVYWAEGDSYKTEVEVNDYYSSGYYAITSYGQDGHIVGINRYLYDEKGDLMDEEYIQSYYSAKPQVVECSSDMRAQLVAKYAKLNSE